MASGSFACSARGCRGLFGPSLRGCVSFRWCNAIRLLLIDVHFRNLCAIHARRVTIMVKDIQLTRRIRGIVQEAAR